MSAECLAYNLGILSHFFGERERRRERLTMLLLRRPARTLALHTSIKRGLHIWRASVLASRCARECKWRSLRNPFSSPFSFTVPQSGTRPSRERLRQSHLRSRGFTLIELLFVVLLLGTVMTVIMASFEGGFRVYDRVSAFGTGEMEAYLAGETIARDLKNALQTGETPFAGEAQAMEMLTVATVGEAEGQLLKVRYQVGESGVQRVAMLPAGTAASAIEAEGIDRLLGSGFALRLRYQGLASGGGSASGWSDTWAGRSNLPVAVQFEIAGDALAEGPVVRTVLLETAAGEEAP